MKNSGYIMPER